MDNGHGLVTIFSEHSVHETLDRAEALIEASGNQVFARIDHQAAAIAAGLSMLPMQLIIFGNPRAGTPLMVATPTLGLELPLKLLAWQGADGRVWLTFDSLVWLGARHDAAAVADRLQVLEANLRALADRAGAGG